MSPDGFTLAPTPTTAAIRTVTRREIVPGGVELPNGTTMFVGVQNDEVSVNLDELWLDAESLREAAHMLNQFAEVLEENAMKEAA